VAKSKPPDPSPAFAIAAELRAAVRKITREAREHGNAAGLTPSELAVVLRLEQGGPATASGLARSEIMRPQSMAAVVKALGTRGFIRGRSDPVDGRQTLFALTDAARHWLKQGRDARQDWLSHVIAERLSPEEQEHLMTAIGLLRRLAKD
jgi:DNA-binding MarR family transcriptional regulator